MVPVAQGFSFRIHSLQKGHHDTSAGVEMLAEIAGCGLSMILQVIKNLPAGLPVGCIQNDDLIAQLEDDPAPKQKVLNPLLVYSE